MEGKRGAELERKEPDMTQDLSRPNATAIGMTATRIAGTAAIALTMLLGISAAIHPAAAQIVAPVPVAQAVELAAYSTEAAPLGLQTTPVIFKKHGGFHGRSYKGGNRYRSVKKFGHSGVGIKKYRTPIHGYHGKSFQSHGFHGCNGYRGFKRY